MGANPTLKRLDDLVRHKANLRVTCTACGRSALFSARDVIGYFQAKRLNAAWYAAGSYFRCEGGLERKGCGHKGAWLEMVPAQAPPIVTKPQPTELQLKQEARRRR